MTKYPLEWGWHTNSSTASDWKPKPTMLSGSTELAAAGDLKCQGVCSGGGTYGTTGAYDIGGKPMCRNCAVKILKIEDLPGSIQNEKLQGLELR